MKRIYLLMFLILAESSFCDSLSVMFLGDTYFGEAYQRDPKFNHGTNILEERSFDSFFENVKNELLNTDLVIANLETTLAGGDHMPESQIGNYLHYSDTESTPLYLAKYNIKAVTLANNHSMDLGSKGLFSTISSLGNSGIVSFGAGSNEKEASKPIVREFISGGKIMRIYVIGCYWQREFFEKKGYYSDGGKSGVNKLDVSKIAVQISEIKSKDENAFVVIFPHWGSNYKPANSIQSEIAHILINAGCDMIIGHAAHTIQEAELYNGKWIFYNIGNFIFNAPGRYSSTGAKPYGLMIRLVLSSKGVTIRLYPLLTDNKKNNYCLRPLDAEEMYDCLNSLETSSSSGKLKHNEKGFIEVQ